MKVVSTNEGGLMILPETAFEIKYLEKLKFSIPEISFFNLGEKSEIMGGLKIIKKSKEKIE